jgi:hypothetical protein
MIKPSKTIAAAFAFSAFAVAVASGIVADVPASQVLMRSVVAMISCYLLGWGIGMVCEHVVRSQVRQQGTGNGQ